MYLSLFLIILLAIVLLVIWRFSYREEREKVFITTEDGRIQIFHGMNVISAAKHDPLRVGSTTREDFMQLSTRWGFNAVRLLIFWDGIEPEKGRYDDAYLARVRQRLDWCAEAGLAVILDMHQDLYSIQFGGDGAPDWAIFTDDQPFERQTPWELNYLQPAVKAAINNFWLEEGGHPELQDHFIRALLKALDALADHPAVVGIDLYNEPTMATLQGLMRFERHALTPFLQRTIDAIREKHHDLWLFYEPSALGPNQGFRSGLGRLKDPRRGGARLVYFPHIYTLDLDISGRYLGRPLFINFWAHQRKKEAQKFNAPMMVGEFGLDEGKPGALDFLSETLAMFDRIASGWFYWSYDRGSWGLQNKGGEELKKAAVLERPYPQKIAGTQPNYKWKPEKQTFNLGYRTDPSNHPLVTEIYLPTSAWPNGWELTNDGVEIKYDFDATARILSITAKQAGRVNISVVGKGS